MKLAEDRAMFVIYSNRLGCAGSILITLIGSVIVIGIIWLFSR